MGNQTIYDNLVKEADYALNSHSLCLAYEAYGAVKMALRLDAITQNQFWKLNNKLVRDGINNPRAELE